MASLRSVTAATLLFLSAAQAHFLLKLPSPIGDFNEDTESTAPCGGLTPNFASQAPINFFVGGDAIATLSAHTQIKYLYRITTDESASGNWTQLYQVVEQDGLGTFCASAVTVPDSFIGKTAVLSIVADSPDGILYQCANVKLVQGVNTAISNVCANSSTATGSYTSDSTLTALLGSGSSSGGSSSSTSTSTHTATGTSTATTMGSATSSAAAATTTTSTTGGAGATYGSLVDVRSLLTISGLMAVGAALMI